MDSACSVNEMIHHPFFFFISFCLFFFSNCRLQAIQVCCEVKCSTTLASGTCRKQPVIWCLDRQTEQECLSDSSRHPLSQRSFLTPQQCSNKAGCCPHAGLFSSRCSSACVNLFWRLFYLFISLDSTPSLSRTAQYTQFLGTARRSDNGEKSNISWWQCQRAKWSFHLFLCFFFNTRGRL